MPFLFWKESFPLRIHSPTCPYVPSFLHCVFLHNRLPCTPSFLTLHSRMSFPQDPRCHPGFSLLASTPHNPCCPHCGCPEKLLFSHEFDSQITAALMGSAPYSNTQHRSGCWALILLHAFSHAVLHSISGHLPPQLQALLEKQCRAPCPVAFTDKSTPVALLFMLHNPLSAFQQALHLRLLLQVLHNTFFTLWKHHSEVSHMVALESTVVTLGTQKRPGSCLCHLAVGSWFHFCLWAVQK